MKTGGTRRSVRRPPCGGAGGVPAVLQRCSALGRAGGSLRRLLPFRPALSNSGLPNSCGRGEASSRLQVRGAARASRGIRLLGTREHPAGAVGLDRAELETNWKVRG